MEQFQGAERLIVQTIMDSPKDSAGYVEDTQIARPARYRFRMFRIGWKHWKARDSSNGQGKLEDSVPM